MSRFRADLSWILQPLRNRRTAPARLARLPWTFAMDGACACSDRALSIALAVWPVVLLVQCQFAVCFYRVAFLCGGVFSHAGCGKIFDPEDGPFRAGIDFACGLHDQQHLPRFQLSVLADVVRRRPLL